MPPEQDKTAESISQEPSAEAVKTASQKVKINPVSMGLFRVVFTATVGLAALVGGKEARATEPTIPHAATAAAQEPIRVFPKKGEDPTILAIPIFMGRIKDPNITEEQLARLFIFEIVETKPSGVVILRAVPERPRRTPEAGSGPYLTKAKKLAQETQTNPLRVFPEKGQSPTDAAINMFMKKAGLAGMTKDQVKNKFIFTLDEKPSGVVFAKVAEKGRQGLLTLEPALKNKMSYKLNSCLARTRKNHPDFRGKIIVTFYFKKGKLDKIELKGDQSKTSKMDFEIEILSNFLDLEFQKTSQILPGHFS